MPLWFLALGLLAAATASQHADGVKVHASTEFVRWTHPDQIYAIEHPSDWQAHAQATRTNIGSVDGLVRGQRGFRTVYGAILATIDDPVAGQATRTLAESSRGIVDSILKRNAHLQIQTALAEDQPLAGTPAYRAVLGGTSPVTGHAERAEVIVRAYDAARVFYVIFACPEDQCAKLAPTFGRMRASLWIPSGPK